MLALPELGLELERLLGVFESPSTTGLMRSQFLVTYDRESRSYCLYRDRELLHCSVDSPSLLTRLVVEINATAIASFTGLAAHAGVVADGVSAIAYVGRSGTGKSTMVGASLSTSFDYVSDEALCVPYGSRCVVPYPKPIQLSARSRELLGLSSADCSRAEALVTHADLGGSLASSPLELTHIVRLARRRGPAKLFEVPGSDAVTWLLEHAFNHFKRPKATFLTVTELAARCRTWVVEYEDALEASALVARHVTGE